MNLAAPPPDSEELNVVALALAATVHLLLIGALFFGVQWKSQAPSAVEVEVWRAAPSPAPVTRPEPTPEPPPPPKPEPKPVAKVEPPPPIKPDIAVKEEKKPKKEEPKKTEPKKEEPKKPETKKEEPKKPEPDRRPNFDDELKSELKQHQQQKTAQDQRMRAEAELNQLGQLKAEQAAASRKQGQDKYGKAIGDKIRGLIILPQNIQGNPEANFKIAQLPSGDVLSVKLSKSSGNKQLDDAIERAILKASPLPKPDRPDLFQRELELKYKPFLE